MKNQSVKELGRLLPERIQLLSSLIARKPNSFTPEWASSIDQAFSNYTRTNTVNLVNSLNGCLIDLNWPFPAYLNLRVELQKPIYCGDKGLNRWQAFLKRMQRRNSPIYIVLKAKIADAMDGVDGSALCDKEMVSMFERYRDDIFCSFADSNILQSKRQILKDIEKAYCQKMWAACITTTYPLLDFIIRTYFNTEQINVSIQVLRDAFFTIAKLHPKDLMPGYSIWDGKSDPEKGNTLAKTIEEDLRLPGIYLSSFFEFADKYYGWYKSTKTEPQTPLNRHAIMHCSSEYWTQSNAVKVLTFLDLTIRLESVLKILIHGEEALAELDLQIKK